MEKVVVIGGAGFLGSHVADELSRCSYKVTVFDKKVSPWISADQEMVVGDMRDIAALTKVLEGASYLYHFGGVSDISEARDQPLETIETNVMGAVTALEASIVTGVKRFLYASTMYVYSSYGSFYRASKQAAETFIEAYGKRFNLDYTLLRYGSLYGPRAQDWNGLRQYVAQITREGRLNYKGTGRERREYIHVRDAARLSVGILADDQHCNEAVTLTGSQILNSKDLIEMIFEIAGAEENVTFLDDERSEDHYSMTPYRYTPKQAKKLVPSEFVDIGQGILEIFEEIDREIDNS
jgi:UDP-glucose 4-epimerase